MPRSLAKNFVLTLLMIAAVVILGWFLWQSRQNSADNNVDTTDWLTMQSPTGDFKFQYPPTFGPNFMSVDQWPPALAVTDGTFSCATDVQKIHGHDYCISSQSEGAAGSIYTSYNYLTEHSGKLVTVTMTVRSIQCDNYDEPNKTACTNERNEFDLDSLVDNIVSTITTATP